MFGAACDSGNARYSCGFRGLESEKKKRCLAMAVFLHTWHTPFDGGGGTRRSRWICFPPPRLWRNALVMHRLDGSKRDARCRATGCEGEPMMTIPLTMRSAAAPGDVLCGGRQLHRPVSHLTPNTMKAAVHSGTLPFRHTPPNRTGPHRGSCRESEGICPAARGTRCGRTLRGCSHHSPYCRWRLVMDVVPRGAGEEEDVRRGRVGTLQKDRRRTVVWVTRLSSVCSALSRS